MYNSDKTALSIKRIAKEKGIATGKMLSYCGLNKDTLNTMTSRGSWIQSNSLAKIADYLDCSVDYLLGRTDNPQAHIKATTVNNKLIALLSQLTDEQQVMLEAQIKGLLEQKKDPPPNGDGK